MRQKLVWGAMVAAVILMWSFVHLWRWQIINQENVVIRLDRYSGRVDMCLPDNLEVRAAVADQLRHCDGSDPTTAH